MSNNMRRILVADDEDAIRHAFRDALTSVPAKEQDLANLEDELFGNDSSARAPAQGFELTCVAQGQEAVDAVRASLERDKAFGVVFLDMRMPPGIDGTTTALEIRKLDPFINIVLVTGYSDIDVGEVSVQVLPADKLFFIAKPFQVAEIRQQAAALSARWVAETAMVRHLQTQNRELQSAVTDAHAARQEAEKASIAKSSFLANVSHELRTPLNAIIGFSDMMAAEAHGPLGDPRYVDYSREIQSSGSGLLSSINDLIDTARLDIGKIDLRLEHLDIFNCVDRVLAELKAYATRKSVELSGPSTREPMVVSGDNKRLHQTMLAILHNAIKFTPPGQRVDVEVAARDGHVVVAICDHGPGIPADLVDAVGRPFSYGNDIIIRAHGGLGLGLSIAKRLIELHNGRVQITTSDGKGTTVELYLPKTAAAHAA